MAVIILLVEEPETAISNADNPTCDVLRRVRARLTEDCPYGFYFRDITYEHRNGVLTLRGQLPTFYLKQVLQTWLRDVDGVERIDNQVDVVSSTGLSSVRPR